MSRDAVRQAAARRTGWPRPRRVEMSATVDEQKRAVLLCRETAAEQGSRLHVRGCGERGRGVPSSDSISGHEEMAEKDVSCRQVRACRWRRQQS